MKLRALIVLLSCLAFFATQLGGVHYHVADPHGPAAVFAADADSGHDHVGHDHFAPSTSHVISGLAADHATGHASHEEIDVGSPTGPLSKGPSAALALLTVVLWISLLVAVDASRSVRVRMSWLRPPPIRRWPTLLLPPSQGPPRAI